MTKRAILKYTLKIIYWANTRKPFFRSICNSKC